MCKQSASMTAVLISTILTVTFGPALASQQVSVHVRNDCCPSSAATIQLAPGAHTLTYESGAWSPWSSDNCGHSEGCWYAKVTVDCPAMSFYEILGAGPLRPSRTAAEAEAVGTQIVFVNHDTLAVTLRFYINDGCPQDYCWDNRPSSGQIFISIDSGDYVGFIAVPSTGISPLEVTFENQSAGNLRSWHWDFGNGSQHDGPTPPPQTFTTNRIVETFTATLVASGPNGSFNASQAIRVLGYGGIPDSAAYSHPVPAKCYLMLGIPLDFPAWAHLSWALASLGAPGMRTWRGYSMTGSVLSEDPILSPLRGYWLATMNEIDSLWVEGLALPDTCSVEIEPGWNLIGVPSLEQPFLWWDLQVEHGDQITEFASVDVAVMEANVWWWIDETADWHNNGSFRASGPGGSRETSGSSDLNPWGAYFVFAREACTLIYPHLATQNPDLVALGSNCTLSRIDAAPQWRIRLSAHSEQAIDRYVELGARSGTLQGRDRGDILKPPSPATGLRLAIVQESQDWSQYMCAYGPTEASTLEWTLAVTGPEELVTLRWDGILEIPIDRYAHLIDVSSGRAIDMRAEEAHQFVLNGTDRMFRVRITNTPFAGDLLGPPRTSLHSVKPNPSCGDVFIDYEIGQAGPVRLRALDVTGRHVATLLDGLHDRGAGRLTWSRGREKCSPGVYYIWIDSPAGRDVRRILLVR